MLIQLNLIIKIDIDISGVDARIIRHEADHDTLLAIETL